MKITTAIIGLGKIGLTYDFNQDEKDTEFSVRTHCRAVSESYFFEITTLIDLDSAALEFATRKYGGQGFKSLSEVKHQASPRLVIISLPTSEHLNTLLEISNFWHPDVYLIEKPFGASSSEARKMNEVLLKQNSKVYVNYIRRFLPNFKSLKSSKIFDGRGSLLSVKITGYGTLLNIFSHFLDLLIYLEDSSILGHSVKSTTRNQLDNCLTIETSKGKRFDFVGIGGKPRECEMLLSYEKILVSVLNNGKTVKVFDYNGTILDSFDVSSSIFNAYQAVVLNQIASEFEMKDRNQSTLDAINIHEFFESI